MPITDAHRATAWQAQSLLLSYPDEALFDRLGLLRVVAGALPDRFGGPLRRLVDHLASTPRAELAADYVATFDHTKRCSLYLTYYAYGDTRKRGMALLRFKQAYCAAGVHLDPGELPDHLAVVLEFAATVDPRTGQRLLIEQRAGLELLRLALRDLRSPWVDVLESVSATLPALAGRDHDAVAKLLAKGPPAEEVGLTPYDLMAKGSHR